jgi:hypothetical protein
VVRFRDIFLALFSPSLFVAGNEASLKYGALKRKEKFIIGAHLSQIFD